MRRPPPPPPKPGIIALRPLGVGEILDGAISAIRGYPRMMLGLSAVVAAITQVLIVPVTWLLLRDSGDQAFSFDRPATSTPEDDVTFAASAITAAGVQVVVTLVASLVLTGILTVAVSRAVLGQSISARDAWDAGQAAAPGAARGDRAGAADHARARRARPGARRHPRRRRCTPAAVAIAFVLGVPAFVVVAAYLYTAFALAPPAIVLERQGVVASLRRSRSLVRGAWWRTFGILLLVNLIAQVLAGILGVPFTVLTLLVAWRDRRRTSTSTRSCPLLVTALGTIVASAVTWPFTAVSTALHLRRPADASRGTRPRAGARPPGCAGEPARPARVIASVPVELGRDEAAQLAREELAKQVYRDAGPGLVERLVRWLLEQAGRLLDGAAGVSPGGYAGLVVVLLLVAAAVVAVRLKVGPLGRRAAREEALFVGRTRTAAQHRAAADAHAAAGAWAEAVRERLRAVVRSLEERAVLDERPGRTADEAAAEAGRALPSCAAGAAGCGGAVRRGLVRRSPRRSGVLRRAARPGRPGAGRPPRPRWRSGDGDLGAGPSRRPARRRPIPAPGRSGGPSRDR